MKTGVIQVHKTTAGQWTYDMFRQRAKQSLVADIQLSSLCGNVRRCSCLQTPHSRSWFEDPEQYELSSFEPLNPYKCVGLLKRPKLQ